MTGHHKVEWVDQFSGESLYIGRPGDENYGLNPFFNQYAGTNAGYYR
jgi:hypothetical protein